MVTASCALASDHNQGMDPFGFDPAELDPIRYSRSDSETIDLRSTGADASAYTGRDHMPALRQTQFSFKLRPKLPDFSREGAYGLDLFSDPRLEVQSRLSGPAQLDKAIAELHDGLVYQAGVKIEHEDEDIDGTAYVSSSLLGLSYGRLGTLWYGGIDLNIEQFADDQYGTEHSEVLSLDVTTGRRLGFTGLSTSSPLWLLSVQGNFDMREQHDGEEFERRGDWTLNPSLFWQQPGFTFSAQMQLPVEIEPLDEEGEPDYRLRAVFEKQFK